MQQTFKRTVDRTLLLTLSTGEIIETTEEHPFYIPGSGFKQAQQLGVGTSIVTRAGPIVQVKSIEVKQQPNTVYNFEVENWHSYFVGNSGLWAHNVTCAERWRQLEKLKGQTKLNHFVLKSKLYGNALHSAFETLQQLAPPQVAASGELLSCPAPR